MSYRCLNGRRFDDGTTDKKIICTNVGLWNESFLTCDCKHTSEKYMNIQFTSVNVMTNVAAEMCA